MLTQCEPVSVVGARSVVGGVSGAVEAHLFPVVEKSYWRRAFCVDVCIIKSSRYFLDGDRSMFYPGSDAVIQSVYMGRPLMKYEVVTEVNSCLIVRE